MISVSHLGGGPFGVLLTSTSNTSVAIAASFVFEKSFEKGGSFVPTDCATPDKEVSLLPVVWSGLSGGPEEEEERKSVGRSKAAPA